MAVTFEDVRHALTADLDELEATLGRAFEDDPMMRWMYPDDDTRPAFTRQFMRFALDLGHPHGHTYTVGNNWASAIWAPPDVTLFDESRGALLWALLSEQVGERVAEVMDGLMRIGSAHPEDDPHFYLFVIGTEPDQQSKGLGGRLLQEVLTRCDRQGLGAYLESSNIKNVPFYEQHGFRVLHEIFVGEDFVARPMWREPAG